MTGALLFFFCYWLLLEILPYVPEFLYGLFSEVIFPLLGFILRLVGKAIELIFRVMAAIISMAARVIWNALVFLYFLVDEARHGGEEPEEDDDQFDDDADPYEAALNLLGLQDHCTQEQFTRAFRRAMAQAHPDKGGTHEQAMAVNTARTIIKSRNGWR